MFMRLETKITIIENFNDYTKYFTDQCILIIVVRKNVQNNVQKKKKNLECNLEERNPLPKISTNFEKSGHYSKNDLSLHVSTT